MHALHDYMYAHRGPGSSRRLRQEDDKTTDADDRHRRKKSGIKKSRGLFEHNFIYHFQPIVGTKHACNEHSDLQGGSDPRSQIIESPADRSICVHCESGEAIRDDGR
jgi:hypothetical protein